MLKLSAMVHTRKKGTVQEMERFLSHHPQMELFLCCLVLPLLVLMAVSVLCCTVMFPISFFMGWL